MTSSNIEVTKEDHHSTRELKSTSSSLPTMSSPMLPTSTVSSFSLSRSSSLSSSLSLARVALCLGCLLLLAPDPSDAYFNRMMSCPQFCQMLAHSHVHQLWCMIDMCKGQETSRQVLRYAKRTPQSMMAREDPDDMLEGLRMLLGRKHFLSFDYNKRDKEYWEGPAPADINH